MCYWRHQAVEDPYIRIGEQDMTAHVNFSDLMEEAVARNDSFHHADGLSDPALAFWTKSRNLATAGDAGLDAAPVKDKET